MPYRSKTMRSSRPISTPSAILPDSSAARWPLDPEASDTPMGREQMRYAFVQEFLERSADRLPDKVALVCRGKRLTYAEIEAEANRMAHALSAHGIGRGDRVALYLNNSVELVVSLFAALKAGAVFVVINPTTKLDKLAYILRNCQSSGLITSPCRADVTTRMLRGLPGLRLGVVPPGGDSPAAPAKLTAPHPLL